MNYPLITYSANLGCCGSSKGPFISIRADLKDDAGLLAHELTHVRQWLYLSLLGLLWLAGCYQLGLMQWASLGLISLVLKDMLYSFVPAFRCWAEVQAYRTQISYGLDPGLAAYALSHDYELSITTEQALAKLKA